MSYLTLYFQAHQPRRLKKNPTLAAPFDDPLDEQIFNRVASKCYLPANALLGRLVEKYPDFRICLGVSGTLLEQARRFNPEVVKSFQRLGKLARDTGRVEFLAETYYHSLAGLFRDGGKEEFRAQVNLHAALLEELLGVVPTAFRNTELLYNNSIARVVGELGFKAMLCERRGDFMAGHSPNAVFTDVLKKLKVLPRNDGLSDELAFRFSHRHFTADEFAAWVGKVDGEAVLIGLDYEAIGEHQWSDTGIFEFWAHLPQALTKVPNVLMRNPSELAATVTGELPVADIDDLATSSWADEGRNTNAWLGNRAQQDGFQRYQELEAKAKASADGNLLEIWRNLGTSDHYYYMCTTRHGADGGVHDYFSHFGDLSLAILAYASILTELRCELGGVRSTFQIKRHARRPRILLVTPEVTELPAGIGNLANFVRAKGGGLADISAALVAELLRMGLDVHVALPKYDRQICDYAQISVGELDRLVSLFHTSEAIHLVQDSAFSHLQQIYEYGGPANPALHRAEAFQRAVINQIFDVAMPAHGKMLVHCNDWMTGLIPAAARARGMPSLFTVHNIHTDKDTLRNLEKCGLNVARFWRDLFLEKHPDFVQNAWDTVGVDFLLSGIKAAHFVNTVSPSFLLEIVNGYFPDLISWQVREEFRAKFNTGTATGIINAPKSNVDPRTSPGLKRNFDENTVMEAKRENKVAFQQQLGLNVAPEAALFFWPHRLYGQKGPQLLAEIAMSLVHHYWNDHLQIAIVGNGDAQWEQAFGTLAMGSQGRMAFQAFDDALSELGKAAADFILMPSLYEPCGLPQMEGVRYGTLPVVRATGGLKDTIQHLDVSNDTGNGFVFNDFKSDALWWAIAEAMKFQRLPADRRHRILRRVMREGMHNFNLEKTTLQYVRLYERLLGEKLI
ncbi:MAG: glycogen/starch synthase [bacterium]